MKKLCFLCFLFAALFLSLKGEDRGDVTRSHSRHFHTIDNPKWLKSKALLYKTLPDYRQKVPVEMRADKSAIMDYPFIHEVTNETAPVVMRNGYLLDKQGISLNTMFVDIDRHYYEQLENPLNNSDLNRLIILPSYIETLVILPITNAEAMNRYDLIDSLINVGFPGCKIYHGRGIQYGDPDFILGTNY